MDIHTTVKNLHPLEIKVLKNFKVGETIDGEKLAIKLGYKEGHANQVFSWLQLKGFVKETDRVTHTFFELTETGIDFAENGTPERRILNLLKEKGKLSLPEIAVALTLENKDVGSAFGSLSREGAVRMDPEKKAEFLAEPTSERLALIHSLLQKRLTKKTKHFPKRI